MEELFGIVTEFYHTKGGESRIRVTLPNGKRKSFSYYALLHEGDGETLAAYKAGAERLLPEGLQIKVSCSSPGGFTFGCTYKQ